MGKSCLRASTFQGASQCERTGEEYFGVCLVVSGCSWGVVMVKHRLPGWVVREGSKSGKELNSRTGIGKAAKCGSVTPSPPYCHQECRV